MKNSQSTSLVFHTLSPDAEADLADSIRDIEAAGLTCSLQVQNPGPQAFIEWLFPTALLLWVGDKYFGAMLSEAGKDHYKLLKQGMEKLYEKTLKPGAPVSRDLRRQDGSRISDKYFSGNLSFSYASPEGWTVKLLFPLDVSVEQYQRSCSAFSKLVTDHLRDSTVSPLEAEIQSAAEEQAEFLPEEITAAHMRHRVRLLVFWNSAEQVFYVPDPAQSGLQGTLVARPLGTEA
jgi:hypothetical protein